MTPRLILHKNPVCSFNANWLLPTINQYLEFRAWDPGQQYPRHTLFYMNLADFSDDAGYQFAEQLVDSGFRVVIDNLWEADPGPVPNTHRITCDRWFWYNEALWYHSRGYSEYQPCPSREFLGLMPMNRRRLHRTEFAASLGPTLDRMLWSYVEAGRQLPGDLDMNNWDTQRYFNPTWYDQTYLSMVVETAVRPPSRYTPVFITEKTTKPLAFQHPFIIYGTRNTLRTLQEWGFETFNHLWDESYDSIVDTQQRKHAVINLLNSIEPCEHSAETREKLQHNHYHFFDLDLVRQRIVKEILEPIINYAETDIQ